MKKLLFVLLAGFLVLGMVGSAGAAPFTFDMGANSSVDTSGTNNVLEMYANVNADLDDITYSLNLGESYTFYFATIGTTESWINNDDFNPGTINATLEFDNPDLVQAIGGSTVGFSGCFNYTQGWNLTWNDPVAVDFGNGGRFSIELSDVGYKSGLWQGPGGSATVNATVTFDTAPVPEPSTILLMGAGLLGLVGYNRKRFSKKS